MFLNAVKTASTTPVNIIGLGDSVTEGQGCETAFIDNRWLQQFSRIMQGRYQSGGLGFTNSYSSVTGSTTGTAGWSFTAGNSDSVTGDDLQAFGGRRFSPATNSVITFSFVGTSCLLHYRQGIASIKAWSYTLDGGSPVTVTPATTGGDRMDGAVATAVLSHGSHTVVMTPTTNERALVHGAFVYDGDETNSIHVWEHAKYGITSTNYLAGGTAAPGALAGLAGPLSSGLCANPALVLIFLGLNDGNAGVAAATYQSNITSIIANYRSYTSVGASIVLICPYSTSYGDTNAPGGNMNAYKAALINIRNADPANTIVVDLRDMTPPTLPDNLHPNNAGHLAIAQFIAKAIPGSISRTTSDTAGGTDAATRVVHGSVSTADTAGGADAVSRVFNTPRTASDTAGATDAAAGTILSARTAADTAGGTDVATRAAQIITRSGSDTAGGTDSATGATTKARTSTDTAGGADSASRVAIVARTAADTAGGSDAASRAIAFVRTATDVAGGTDAAAGIKTLLRTTGDTAGGTDSATRSLFALRTGSDTAGGTDVATRTVDAGKTATDAAGGTDVATRAAAVARTTSDAAGGTDVATRITSEFFTASDTAGGTDVAVHAYAALRTSADTAGGTDAATRLRADARTASDTAGATDFAVGSIPPNQARSCTDTAGGTDVATRAAGFARTAADTAGGTDTASPTRQIGRSAADTAGATDVAGRLIRFGRTAIDIAGASDSLATILARARVAFDVAGGTDAAIRHLAWLRSASDTAGGSDVVTGHFVPAPPILHADIDADDVSLQLDPPGVGAAFAISGSIIIDSEEITYTSRTGDVLSGCSRGQHGTFAAAHSAGALVSVPVPPELRFPQVRLFTVEFATLTSVGA